jgi:hypothetical protein
LNLNLTRLVFKILLEVAIVNYYDYEKYRLASDIKSGSLARGNIFYEGLQAALRDATIDENDVVNFIEICYF